MKQRQSFNRPPQITKESILLIGDAQVPFQDIGFIRHVKDVAKAWGIRSCVWGGDMVDFHALSPFFGRAKGEADDELSEDAEGLIEIAEGFDRIVWIRGNHEDRLSRAINKWLRSDRIRMMLGLSDVIKASDYYHCLIGREWIAEHPKSTSEIPARAAVWLAEKYNRNVIMFHNHLTGWAQTRDGVHLGIEAGMCADVDKMEWVSLRHSKRPQMTQGAVILRWNGHQYYPYQLTRWTDWDFEIGRFKAS